MKNTLRNKISTMLIVLVVFGIALTSVITTLLLKAFIPEMTTVDGLENRIIKYEMIAVVIGFAVSVFLGNKYIRTVTDPLIRLSYITDRLSRGELAGKRIYSARTNDEIDDLSVSFNRMNQRLTTTIDELRYNNSKMNAVLSSMSSGVIALDIHRNIMMINPYAEDIFGMKKGESIGRNISEVIFDYEINQQIRNLSLQNQEALFELEMTFPVPRICSFRCSLMKQDNDPTKITGIVIIIQDITEIRRLENMRRDFVANVSHELKTPLTSIKGFVETLKDGAVEDEKIRMRFLDIIDIEADRLVALIQDILALSEIENKEMAHEFDEIAIDEVAREVVSLLSESAGRKGLEFTSSVQQDLEPIYGDRALFKQMLINLMDNAIKYTPDGGSVGLDISETGRSLRISVKDTGIGIPQEDIPRLFERFYRVDKARSRQVGGTGLGLAIVKHIVLSFDGNIAVKSREGKGSEFLITIPIKK